MINKLFQAASQEIAFASIFIVTCKVFDWLRGRIITTVLGWPSSYLGPGSRVLGTRAITVGGKAYINRYAWIEAVHNFRGQVFHPEIIIGRGLAASDRLHISSVNRIEIGDNCLFGSGVYISDHNHGSYRGETQSAPSELPIQRSLTSEGIVIIGSNVWLGDNVVVLGPVRIGNGAVVGANSVVTRDIPDNVIAAGVPVRILKRFDESTGRWEKIDQ